MSAIENSDRQDDAKIGSERGFGIVFAVVFALLAMWQLWVGRPWGWGLLAVAVAFLALGFLAPDVLAPLNRMWFKFGLLLHRVANPVILGILFYAVVMPTGFLMRAAGKRPLNLELDDKADSYWVRRAQPGLDPDSFTKQF